MAFRWSAQAGMDTAGRAGGRRWRGLLGGAGSAASGSDAHWPDRKSEVADIGYFDVSSGPRRVGGARLPWSIRITANSPAVVGNVVAQGDRDSIGCRIVIDGQVKAERISNEVNAFTYCRVKGA
jgi:hypothetical protein